MKYCKRCHILYSSCAAACPKCGADEAARKNAASAEPCEADKKTVRRDWIWLAVGIPLLIGIMYLIVFLVKLAG